MDSYRKSITSEEVLVTPAMAEVWIRSNFFNRTIKQRLVDRYASDMLRGEWVDTGEPIIFGVSNRLLDGQHRLRAIIQSGVSVRTIVTRGITEERKAFEHIDSGPPKSNPDRLSAVGEKNTAQLAATLYCLYRYHCGLTSRRAYEKLPSDIMFALLDKLPEIRYWNDCGKRMGKLGFQPSRITFVMFAGSVMHASEAHSFQSGCETGENLKSGNPISVLRNRVMTQSRSLILHPDVSLALYIKTWNAYVLGKEVMHLQFNPDRERFPQVIGYPSDPSFIDSL